MADDQNAWVPPSPDSGGIGDLGPAAPPSPPEVRVRTFRSDVESMAMSGGGPAEYRNVQAPALSSGGEEVRAEGEKKSNSALTLIIVLLAILLFAGVGYFAYQLFFKGSAPPTPPAAQLPFVPPPAPPQPSANAVFTHASFFKKPADQLFALTINSTAQDPADLETVNQKILSSVAAANPTGNMLEINFKDGSGSDLEAQKVFDAADIGLLDPQLLVQHFTPDATFFVYAAKSTSTSGRSGVSPWPGVVLSLKPGENWLFVKNDVMKLEQSAKLTNFFLTAPGIPDPAGFKDTIESGQPARILKFSSSTTGAVFVYGWFHGDLIFSTSEAGLTQAIERL